MKGMRRILATCLILVAASLVEPVATQGLVAAAYLRAYRLNGADWARLVRLISRKKAGALRGARTAPASKPCKPCKYNLNRTFMRNSNKPRTELTPLWCKATLAPRTPCALYRASVDALSLTPRLVLRNFIQNVFFLGLIPLGMTVELALF